MGRNVEISVELAKRLTAGNASKGANAIQLADAWSAMEELEVVLKHYDGKELLPCPLCGAEAETCGYADSDQLFVQCTDCGCSVEVGNGRFEIWKARK
jgi:hypothetical protein